eukprot:5738541-Alexandrium_andersonii.AAC.1
MDVRGGQWVNKFLAPLWAGYHPAGPPDWHLRRERPHGRVHQLQLPPNQCPWIAGCAIRRVRGGGPPNEPPWSGLHQALD